MAVCGGVMVYSAVPACCSAHKTLLLQRSGKFGIPSSDCPAFSMGWGVPGWPSSYYNPLLSPIENDHIVQGKPVVCSRYILQPVLYIPSPFCTLERRCHLAKDHCTHLHAVHLSNGISGEHVFTAWLKFCNFTAKQKGFE